MSSAIREPVPGALVTLAISSISQSQKQHNEGQPSKFHGAETIYQKITQVSEEWLWKRHMLRAKHKDNAAMQQDKRWGKKEFPRMPQ